MSELLPCPICDKAKIEVLYSSEHGSGWIYAVPVETANIIERRADRLDALCRDLTTELRHHQKHHGLADVIEDESFIAWEKRRAEA